MNLNYALNSIDPIIYPGYPQYLLIPALGGSERFQP